MLSVDISLVAVFIIIWILVVVLTKLFFKPVRKVMNQRDEDINQNLKAGEIASGEYERTIRKIEEDIKQAKADAYSLREEFEKEASLEKERILSEVAKDCRAQVKEAKDELEKQLIKLKTGLESDSESIAAKIEKRLIH
jgi:F-type H+-transporting ATPase subunit b